MTTKKHHISYPEISQYRNVIFDIKHRASYTGKDETGEPIYDFSLPLPVVTFTGTVKLDGTNASVVYNAQDGLWVQSRETILEIGQDNAGFCGYVYSNDHKAAFMDLINKVYADNNLSPDEYTVAIFGEWAGKGIMKRTAIATLDKAFYLIGVKIAKPQDEEFKPYWVSHEGLSNPDQAIFNISDYGTYSIDIDFSAPEKSQEQLEKLTLAVGEECPIAKAFGASGIGEGIVWVGQFDGETYRFKIKDERHKISKTKEIAPIDVEKVSSINEFLDYAVTQNRFDQAVEKIFGGYDHLDIKQMGKIIQWMSNDIYKEETDVLVENGLDPNDKQVSKAITERTRGMFMACLKF